MPATRITMLDPAVWLDGIRCREATVTKQTDSEIIRPKNAMMADPAWECVDSKGHFHTFDKGQKLPTLGRLERPVECPDDPDCRIVAEDYYVCVICGDEVEPHWIPDIRARESGTPIVIGQFLKIEAHGGTELGKIPLRRPVSIRVRIEHEELFGIGVTTDHQTDSFGVHVVAQIESPSTRLSPPRH